MNKKSKSPPKHHSHLTFEDRVRIDEMLRRGESFRSIAASLGKTTSTISREIRSHASVIPPRGNDCVHIRECTKIKLCNKPGCVSKKCKSCKFPCRKFCSDYIHSNCEKLEKSPYVCNGCERIHSCKQEHHTYIPKIAQNEYRSMLVERRNGFDLTGEQLMSINEMVSPLISKGQSPYHIKQALGDNLVVSEATLRRMVAKCELDVRNIDLRNIVSRKPRNRKHARLHHEILNQQKIGHTYKDYLRYTAEHEVTAVQMDCVEGKKEDSAVLLTLHFPAFHMQLAFIMNEHTADCVVHTLDMLEEVLGTELFRQVFPTILTDNGHEFADIFRMEQSINGGQRTKIFFCEPNRSDEKGACENNHRFIRYVIPKGTSLEPFGQADISLMMNHINSMFRKTLYGKSPYDVAMAVLPEDFFILLGLEKISPADVTLKPDLIAKKRVLPSK